jgi:hypothetical protein
MQARNWFLTFPQCHVTKQQALDNINRLISGVKGVIVAQETHADGEPHLHIAIFLNAVLHTRNPNYWDFICLKHGNYQTMKSIKGTLVYLKKQDTNPLIYGEVPTTSSSDSQVAKSTTVAEMINSGSNLDQVNDHMPGYFMLNKRKIEEYASWCIMKKQRESVLPMKLPIRYLGQMNETKSIIEWLNMNLLTTRPFKQKQLYLSSPPNYLKTSLILKLALHLRIYHVPLQEDFYDSYSDDDYDLIVIDEFKGQKTVQFLNLFLQGGPMSVKKKGTQSMKMKNLPVIILSNFIIDEVYKDHYKVETLKERLLCIQLTEKIDLDNITIDLKDKEEAIVQIRETKETMKARKISNPKDEEEDPYVIRVESSDDEDDGYSQIL